MTFNIVYKSEPEGGYTISVPALPGCITWADSVEEGKLLIQEAIEAYLESMDKSNDVIQDDSQVFISTVNLQYA